MKTTLSILTIFLIGLTSCKTVLLPNYVNSNELAHLKVGSTKQQVISDLGNTYPFDILAGWSSGCEVHQYKYKIPNKLVPSKAQNNAEYLTSGTKQYVNESNVFIVYKNGKLESVLSDIGKKDLDALLEDGLKVSDACAEKGLRGCKDPLSLNYNPDALVDDGSCAYCECGYTKNPDFNPNRPESECNKKCINLNSEQNGESANQTSDCNSCEILEKAMTNSKANININLDIQSQNGVKNTSGQSNGQKNNKKSEKKSLNNFLGMAHKQNKDKNKTVENSLPTVFNN